LNAIVGSSNDLTGNANNVSGSNNLIIGDSNIIIGSKNTVNTDTNMAGLTYGDTSYPASANMRYQPSLPSFSSFLM